MRKFPIGIQSFISIRRDSYVYVDKTPFVKQLYDEGKYYFLSRPRRFGKSLFLDTLNQAFLGKKELFKGLYLYDNWNWDKKYPVLNISFGTGIIQSSNELTQRILCLLEEWRVEFDIKCIDTTVAGGFSEVIKKISKKLGERVVVLIDEYDKPILDNIENLDVVNEIRDVLKNFYSVLKDCDEYLEFVFLTGVSKFSKVSLFSGLNNLNDLTINKKYSTICGYTQDELEATFTPELVDVDMEKLKKWYNGYSWGNGSVYNPFDILLFLDLKEYKSYWFETGSPTFLIKLIMKYHYFTPRLERLVTSGELIGSFDVENIKLETLLFQTGYLTIKEVKQLGARLRYVLDYPNLEVKMSLNEMLMQTYSPNESFDTNSDKLYMALFDNDINRLKDIFVAFLSSIPNEWYRKNDMARFEGFYATVFYTYFSALGIDLRVEDSTNQGRLDMVVFMEKRCYVFEFKVVDKLTGESDALQQIKEKRYAEKFTADYDEVYLIGVEFNRIERNISQFEWEQYELPPIIKRFTS